MRFEDMKLGTIYKELPKSSFPDLCGREATGDWLGGKSVVKDYRILQIDNRTSWEKLLRKLPEKPLIIAWVELDKLVAWVWGAFFIMNRNEWWGAIPVMRRHIMDDYRLGDIIHEAFEPSV